MAMAVELDKLDKCKADIEKLTDALLDELSALREKCATMVDPRVHAVQVRAAYMERPMAPGEPSRLTQWNASHARAALVKLYGEDVFNSD